MRSTRQWRSTWLGDTSTGVTGVLVSDALMLAPSSTGMVAPASEGLNRRMDDDEGRAGCDEPREQVPRGADHDIGIAVDRRRVAEQLHNLKPARRGRRASPGWPSAGS